MLYLGTINSRSSVLLKEPKIVYHKEGNTTSNDVDYFVEGKFTTLCGTVGHLSPTVNKFESRNTQFVEDNTFFVVSSE